jgi:capsule polysaccharide modification protein KpsS
MQEEHTNHNYFNDDIGDIGDIKIGDIIKMRGELKDFIKKLNTELVDLKKNLDENKAFYWQKKNILCQKLNVVLFMIKNAKVATEIFMNSIHTKPNEYNIDDIICNLEKEKNIAESELNTYLVKAETEFELLKKKYDIHKFVCENIDHVSRNLIQCLINLIEGATNINIKIHFSDNKFTDFDTVIKEIIKICSELNPIFKNTCFKIEKIFTNLDESTLLVNFYKVV